MENNNYRWCLVGNITDKRMYGQKHEIRYGTKNFSPGTKVYIAPHQWGDGGEQRVVLGNPRHKKGYIECVIRREYICNFRIQKVYSPLLLKRMKNSEYSWWEIEENDLDWFKKMAQELNEKDLDKNKIYNEIKEEFLRNIDKITTTELGIERIKNNLKLYDIDIVEYCKNKIKNSTNIYRKGKNWYIEIDNIRITINACSYKIITAHIINVK